MTTTKTLIALAGIFCLAGTTIALEPEKKAEPGKKEAMKEPMKKDAPSMGGGKDIAETAMGTGMHNTLVTALKAAGWVEPLKGKGPFTVFAPTDEAFNKLPKGTVEDLLKPENKEKLATILKFHVIEGKAVMAADVVKMTESVATVQGEKFKIMAKDGKVTIGNGKGMANVTKTDVACSNGVIHVIDSVLMPEGGKGEMKKDEMKKDDKKGEHKGEGKKDDKKSGH